MKRQSECLCDCHRVPGMVHVAACCYPDEPWHLNHSIEKIYIQMSHAGRIVTVFNHIPTRNECDVAYAKYLGKEMKDNISCFNSWVEAWTISYASVPEIIDPIEKM